jgi:ubiquinone/menaquinone biosynthesis C-methylase UbiE
MDRNPQAKQMADESMVRTLAAQADAIWPQEQPIVAAYAPSRILDVGCGTGEFTSRVARLFPEAAAIGVDLVETSLELARSRCADLGDRVTFVRGDAYELPFGDGVFDLVACRHVLQAIPDAPRVLAELVRVLAPGGRLHMIAEDYGMIHAVSPRSTIDLAKFWFETPRAFARATGTDLHVGRHVVGHLRALPVDDVRMHYLAVDTLRVPRATFAAIFEAWRDGYVEPLTEHTGRPASEIRAAFDATIDAIHDPDGFALWLVPVITARRA